VATLAALAAVLLTFAQPAGASELDGLTAPPDAARVVAVGASDGAAQLAAREVLDAIQRGWPSYRALALTGDPAASDCRTKPYAAVMVVTVTPVRETHDVGLELRDCAGWRVDQWHEQGNDVQALALGALMRVQVWMREKPLLAANVFERGLAYEPSQGPTYFYVLYKPADGYMRAIVRPGGPAWVAGLRTGDIVDTVDGKHWWEYGTYQTQLKAYDGKPHDFGIYRGGPKGVPHDYRLGAPFLMQAPR
jgi:hypothetical protein